MSQARAEHVSGSKTLLVRPSVSVSLSLSVSVVLSISLARALFSSRCALCQRGGFDLRQTGKQASTSLRCACGGMGGGGGVGRSAVGIASVCWKTHYGTRVV